MGPHLTPRRNRTSKSSPTLVPSGGFLGERLQLTLMGTLFLNVAPSRSEQKRAKKGRLKVEVFQVLARRGGFKSKARHVGRAFRFSFKSTDLSLAGPMNEMRGFQSCQAPTSGFLQEYISNAMQEGKMTAEVNTVSAAGGPGTAEKRTLSNWPVEVPRSECSCPPRLTCRNPNPQYDAVREWSLLGGDSVMRVGPS